MDTVIEKTQDLFIQRIDKILSNFVVAYFFVQALNLFIKLNIGGLPGWTILSRIILILFLLFCVKPIINKGLWLAVFLEIVLACCFAYTIILGNVVFHEYSSIMINSLTVFIPMALCVYCISDKGILLKRLYCVSWPIQAILLLVLFNQESGTYSMVGGYALIFQVLIVLDHFFVYKKWYDLISVVISFFAVFLFGSRGPIICVIALIIVFIIFSQMLSPMKRVIIIGGVLIVSICFYSNIETVINVLIRITGATGLHSRTLNLWLLHSVTDDSGRSSIYSYYWDMITREPTFGYGLVGGWIGPDVYPHNIFIELLLSFGVFFGCLIAALLIVLAFRAICSRDRAQQRLAHIMCAYSTCLFLSDSLIMCPQFYILIIIGISNIGIRIRLNQTRPV